MKSAFIALSVYLLLVALGNAMAPPGGDKMDSKLPAGDYNKANLVSRERELANRLLERLMDVAHETLRDLGVGEEELQEVERKRAHITRCYFQAISCF